MEYFEKKTNWFNFVKPPSDKLLYYYYIFLVKSNNINFNAYLGVKNGS